MISHDKWQWFGQAGHFCAADQCRYHLHTHVGKYCISTIGEYFVRSDDKKPTPFGTSTYLYETMVFVLDETGSPETYNEIDTKRTKTRDKAAAAHAELCEKYAGVE